MSPAVKGSDCDLDSEADDALYTLVSVLTVQPVKTFKENI